MQNVFAIFDVVLFVTMIILLFLLMRTPRSKPLNEELPIQLFIFGILALTVFRTFTPFGDHIILSVANSLFLCFIVIQLFMAYVKNKK